MAFNRSILTFLFCFFSLAGITQFSVATDASILRNFNQQQKFWAFGQTVQLNFHLSPKESIYTWVSYYTNGKFRNNFSAIAKDATTTPQQFFYTSRTNLRYRHLSVGWKHFFIGSYNSENMWNVYGYAGFGLLLGKAENSYSRSVDTTQYIITSPRQGIKPFKRLTFDAGIGAEIPLGTDVFLYTELRSWTPTSHYPSPYLYKNNYHLPAVAAVNMGLRIVIE